MLAIIAFKAQYGQGNLPLSFLYKNGKLYFNSRKNLIKK